MIKQEYDSELKNADKVVFTYLDLFRYPSLRVMAICTMMMYFSNNFVYYSPLALVDQFGFNFFLNGVILNVAEFITFLLEWQSSLT